MHLPLPLHRSGQPSGWRNGEDEKEGREAALGQQGSHAKGEQGHRQPLGQSQSGAVSVWESGKQAMHAGARRSGVPDAGEPQ